MDGTGGRRICSAAPSPCRGPTRLGLKSVDAVHAEIGTGWTFGPEMIRGDRIWLLVKSR